VIVQINQFFPQIEPGWHVTKLRLLQEAPRRQAGHLRLRISLSSSFFSSGPSSQTNGALSTTWAPIFPTLASVNCDDSPAMRLLSGEYLAMHARLVAVAQVNNYNFCTWVRGKKLAFPPSQTE